MGASSGFWSPWPRPGAALRALLGTRRSRNNHLILVANLIRCGGWGGFSFTYIVEYLFRMVQQSESKTHRFVDLSGRPIDREGTQLKMCEMDASAHWALECEATDVDFAWAAADRPPSAGTKKRNEGNLPPPLECWWEHLAVVACAHPRGHAVSR